MAEGSGSSHRHPYTELLSDDGQRTSPENGRQQNPPGDAAYAADKPHTRERPRVRFTPGGESLDSSNRRSTFGLRDHSHDHQEPSTSRSTSEAGHDNPDERAGLSFSSRLDRGIPGDISESFLNRPRNPPPEGYCDDVLEEGSDDEKNCQQLSAQSRADRLARSVGAHSSPAGTSPTLHAISNPPPENIDRLPGRTDDIPLVALSKRGYGDGSDSDEEPHRKATRPSSTSEAHRLVRGIGQKSTQNQRLTPPESGVDRLHSGQVTPVEERDPEMYVPPPEQYRGGVLSSLLKLYAAGEAAHTHDHGYHRHGSSGLSGSGTGAHSPGSPESSGYGSPKRHKSQKWYSNKSANASTSSLVGLIGASSAMLATPAAGAGVGAGVANPPRPKKKYPLHYTGGLGGAFNRISRPHLEDEIKVTVHIAETLSRQRYLRKLCRALMSYGAPTHRLEGQEGVDLGKLRDTHEIYKEVIHDIIGVEEAIQRLDEIIGRKAKFNQWIIVGMYGLASATVGPFAFGTRPIDLPIAFLLGSILGTLQLVVAPKSDLYSNVFEISAAVITSFLARMFGSIHGGRLFCFSGLAQSSIALILPGYTVLCGSLELQSKSIVAGSVRMFYAIIYSLFLGFGITIGTAIYGLIDPKASSDTTCNNQLPPYYSFLFVPAFTMCLIIINQAKWRQAPIMLAISLAGYVVNYFSSAKFPSNAQISSTLGALTIGVLGNLYSRLRHGLAAAAILPAIFVQVPSGLAAGGSLISGITSADQLNGNATTGNTTVSGGGSPVGHDQQLNSIVFNVGFSMIQVAIGITVGLFLSALIVYPLGKRRSGLFSF
ncbi:hypothetical protein FGG08_000738 [Glutinoglossum americanum]|uniref:Pheromone-regulated membrane protein 10 n=1 Tax=Glutinoglossum americanum TaxID=1670608 RepID=A0A9P8L3G1_9PEZI|nr:hypothetical protein FGG08_000738 [Glutinoglossum americanum]